MTDAPIEKLDEPAEIAPINQVKDTIERDWFLMQLVNQVNDLRIGISITLNVGGTIVSGNLVSGAEFFEGFAKEMAGSFADKDDAEGIRKSYAQFAEIYPKKEFDEDGKEIGGEQISPPPSYLHLADARFFANGQPTIPGNKGVWWRGRIAAVDGFSLGRLSTT